MGTPYFGSNTLRFQVTFNLVTGYFDIVDLLSAAYNATWGLVTADQKEILKVSLAAPGISTTVVYQNAGWAADDFSAPDINGATPTWTFSGAEMPVDADGNIVKGTYTFESKVTFDDGTTVYATNNTYVYDYTPIIPDINETVDCKASTLTSEDLADYTYNNIAPTVVYSHTITKPTGSGATDPGTVAYNKRVIGGGSVLADILWTELWQIYFSNTLTYQAQTWGTYPFIVIYNVAKGYKTVDVQCGSGNCCDVRQCVLNLTTLWKSYYGVDPRRYAELGAKLFQINVEWMNFEFAQGCGEDYDSFCENLIALCQSENCSTPASDTASKPIWPVTSGSGSVSASTFVFTLSNVTYVGTSTGHAGDFHWYTDNSTYLYLQQNIAGTWTAVSGNLYVTSSASPTPATIIENDSSGVGTDNGTSEKTLDTLTITPTDYMDADGDVLHVYAMFQLAQNDDGKFMKLYFGGDIIVSKETDSLINSLNNIVVLEMWITRTGAATQDIVAKMERYGEVINTFTTNTKTLSASLEIKTTGQNNGTVYAANDIVSKKFLVELIKVIPALP